LNDSIIGKELEEYVQIQNDAFDEVMEELGNSDTTKLKSAIAQLHLLPPPTHHRVTTEIILYLPWAIV